MLRYFRFEKRISELFPRLVSVFSVISNARTARNFGNDGMCK